MYFPLRSWDLRKAKLIYQDTILKEKEGIPMNNESITNQEAINRNFTGNCKNLVISTLFDLSPGRPSGMEGADEASSR